MEDADSLMDRLMDSMPEEKQVLALDNEFPYILSKAYSYLEMGPADYRSLDAFGMPSEETDVEGLAHIESGCRQVLEGKGLTKEDPFRGLGVDGFYALFQFFHFRRVRQSLVSTDGGMMDRLEMRHAVDGRDVVYFNLVEYEM